MKSPLALSLSLLPLFSFGPALANELPLRIEPASPRLIGAEARQQLVVSAPSDGLEVDATDLATFQSSNPMVAVVSAEGVVYPVADGEAKITASYAGRSQSITVTVRRAKEVDPLHFAKDIVPLFVRGGCNSGGCHGKQNGQNGFGLSVFGSDPTADYSALVQEGRGRRLFPASPERSLLLTKATNHIPHGGGKRMEVGSTEYRRLVRWIAEGMPKGNADTPQVVAIEVSPKQHVMREKSRQRLLVTARFSDGSQRDVTHESLFTSNDEQLATIDRDGRVTTTVHAGETALVARYHELVATCHVTVPLNKDASLAGQLAGWDRSRFVDRLVAEKWERMRVVPSAPVDDATFLRRAHLDVIGTLPTPAEVAAFLADNRADKRARLVESLLERPEYADFWALRWADLLRVNRDELGAKGAFHFHQWLRRAIERNQPYDQFVRDIVTSQGSLERNGAAHFYKAFDTPNELAVAVSQVFLGVRLDCSRCHHHPYEKWGQDDFYGLAAFFSRVARKQAGNLANEIYVGEKGEVKHPKTLAVVQPRVLLGESLDAEATANDPDPRQHLAAWMGSPKNPFVARTLVNRVWAQLMGRGLVEPIDDMRDTNPATNDPLLAALADDFVQHRFDVKHLIRTITTSRVYGLSSQPNASNLRDTQNYSRAYRKRLSAEVLLDAISDTTESPEPFVGMPPGTRAVQLWDHRLPSVFLDTFGRPQRKTVCQCERLGESTLGQVLHLLNSPTVNDKVTSPTGRAARLAASQASPDEIVTELYLATFGRMPTTEERATARATFDMPGATRRQAAEDVLWALLNSAEFVLNH